MNQTTRPEIVINASLVTNENSAQFYEFVLNDSLVVVDCGHVESLSQGNMRYVDNYSRALHGMLFELNHVRVNPKLDNTMILVELAGRLEESGVYICNPPAKDLMAMCFKPLGELSDIVRFYITYDHQLVFLSSSVKLRCVN